MSKVRRPRRGSRVRTKWPEGEVEYPLVAARRGFFTGGTTRHCSVRIIGCEIVRDADGLALSSRNLYLSADERRRAATLPEALMHARDSLTAGDDVTSALAVAERRIAAAGFARIDYCELVDGERLTRLRAVTPGARLIVAAVMGSTRLIDNVAV